MTDMTTNPSLGHQVKPLQYNRGVKERIGGVEEMAVMSPAVPVPDNLFLFIF